MRKEDKGGRCPAEEEVGDFQHLVGGTDVRSAFSQAEDIWGSDGGVSVSAAT